MDVVFSVVNMYTFFGPSVWWFRYSALFIAGSVYKDKVKWSKFLYDMFGQTPDNAPVPIPLVQAMESPI
jgi:hypothetical protein